MVCTTVERVVCRQFQRLSGIRNGVRIGVFSRSCSVGGVWSWMGIPLNSLSKVCRGANAKRQGFNTSVSRSANTQGSRVTARAIVKEKCRVALNTVFPFEILITNF